MRIDLLFLSSPLESVNEWVYYTALYLSIRGQHVTTLCGCAVYVRAAAQCGLTHKKSQMSFVCPSR